MAKAQKKRTDKDEKLKINADFEDVISISVANPQKVQDSDFIKLHNTLEKEGLFAFGSVTIERDNEDRKQMLLFIRNESPKDEKSKNHLKKVLSNLQMELQIPHLKIW